MCDSCYGEFCDDCLVYPKGRRHPICTGCAIAVASVRGQRPPDLRGSRKTAKQRREDLQTAADDDENVFTFFRLPEATAPSDEGGVRRRRNRRRTDAGSGRVQPTERTGPENADGTADDEPTDGRRSTGSASEQLEQLATTSSAEFPTAGDDRSQDASMSLAELIEREGARAVDHTPVGADHTPVGADHTPVGADHTPVGADHTAIDPGWAPPSPPPARAPVQLEAGRPAEPAAQRSAPSSEPVPGPGPHDLDPVAGTNADDPDPVADGSLRPALPPRPRRRNDRPTEERTERRPVTEQRAERRPATGRVGPPARPPVTKRGGAVADWQRTGLPERRQNDSGPRRRTAPMIGEVRTIGGRRRTDAVEPTPAPTAAPDDEVTGKGNAVDRFDARRPRPGPLAPSATPVTTYADPATLDAAAAGEPVALPGTDTSGTTSADGARRSADTDANGNWIPPVLRGMATDARQAKINLPKRRRDED
ncbi:MAG: hypothetical protein ACFCVK_00540 [Acidimicrobiales bacterium]